MGSLYVFINEQEISESGFDCSKESSPELEQVLFCAILLLRD